jgi:hypothetical protein
MLFEKVMIVCICCDFGRSGIDGYYLGQGKGKEAVSIIIIIDNNRPKIEVQRFICEIILVAMTHVYAAFNLALLLYIVLLLRSGKRFIIIYSG